MRASEYRCRGVGRKPAEPGLDVDRTTCDTPDTDLGIDLVMTHVVTLALELDGAEEELRRPLTRPRGVETGEPSGEVDERDPHRRGRLPSLGSPAMHRQKTKLSKRVNRVASGIERRGIVATYELHERLLRNRTARRRFSSAAPQLDETQRGLVEALDRDGYVTVPFTDVFTGEQWEALDAQGAAFVADTERTLGEGGRGKVRPGKEFVVRAHSFEGVTLSADDAWFSVCASRRMLDIANAYLRLWAKLSYVDLWYTAQQAASDERVASQNWHVDFDDKHLLKAFVYLSDVGPDSGPFEYVRGSQAGGRNVVRPWEPMGYGRVPDEEVLGKVATEEIVTFTGPKGTLILCNTSGLHRGGFATAGPRVLATATYCSPASLRALSNRNYTTTLETTDPVVRYAVS
jgi:hypothetical protein